MSNGVLEGSPKTFFGWGVGGGSAAAHARPGAPARAPGRAPSRGRSFRPGNRFKNAAFCPGLRTVDRSIMVRDQGTRTASRAGHENNALARVRVEAGPCRPGCWASCTLPEYQQAGAIVNRCGLASLSQDQKLYIASRLKRGGAYSVVIALWRFFAWAPGCWACGCCGLPGWLPPGLLLW